jgi:hypothetical protein
MKGRRSKAAGFYTLYSTDLDRARQQQTHDMAASILEH